MTKKGLFLEVRVTPNAARSKVLGPYGEKQIKIAIKSPPVDGKANETLVNFLAEAFSVARKNVELVSGGLSRSKKVFISGNEEELRACLHRLLSLCKK